MVKEEIKRGIREYFEWNENENVESVDASSTEHGGIVKALELILGKKDLKSMTSASTWRN